MKGNRFSPPWLDALRELILAMPKLVRKLAAPKLRVSKLVVLLCALATVAWAAAPQFPAVARGLTSGDQWNLPWRPMVRDGLRSLSALRKRADCKDCRVPTMLLVRAMTTARLADSRVMLETGSGQFDAQIAVDPADRRTLYAAWLQNGKRAVMLAKSWIRGRRGILRCGTQQVELDKPALAVRARTFTWRSIMKKKCGCGVAGWRAQLYAIAVNADSRPGGRCWARDGRSGGRCVSGLASYSKAGGARFGEPLRGEVGGCGKGGVRLC